MSQKSLKGAMSGNKTRRIQKGGAIKANVKLEFPEQGKSTDKFEIDFNMQPHEIDAAIFKRYNLNETDYELWYKETAAKSMDVWIKNDDNYALVFKQFNNSTNADGTPKYKLSIRRQTIKTPPCEPLQIIPFDPSVQSNGNKKIAKNMLFFDKIRPMRGAGNCYYISIMYGLFEKIINDKDERQFNIVLQKLNELKQKTQIVNELLKPCNYENGSTEYKHVFGAQINIPPYYKNFYDNLEKLIAKINKTVANFTKTQKDIDKNTYWETPDDLEKDLLFLENGDVNSSWLTNILVLTLRVLMSVYIFEDKDYESAVKFESSVFNKFIGSIQTLDNTVLPMQETQNTTKKNYLSSFTPQHKYNLLKEFVMRNELLNLDTAPEIVDKVLEFGHIIVDNSNDYIPSMRLIENNSGNYPFVIYLNFWGTHYNIIYKKSLESILTQMSDNDKKSRIIIEVLKSDVMRKLEYGFIDSQTFFNNNNDDFIYNLLFSIDINTRKMTITNITGNEEQIDAMMNGIYFYFMKKEISQDDRNKINAKIAPTQKWIIALNEHVKIGLQKLTDPNLTTAIKSILHEKSPIGLGNFNYPLLEWMRTYGNQLKEIAKEDNFGRIHEYDKAMYFVCENVIIPHSEMDDYKTKKPAYDTGIAAFLSSKQCNCDKSYPPLFKNPPPTDAISKSTFVAVSKTPLGPPPTDVIPIPKSTFVAVSKTPLGPSTAAGGGPTDAPIQPSSAGPTYVIPVKFKRDPSGTLDVDSVNIDVDECSGALPFPDEFSTIVDGQDYLFTIDYDPATPYTSTVKDSKIGLTCSSLNNFKTKLGQSGSTIPTISVAPGGARAPPPTGVIPSAASGGGSAEETPIIPETEVDTEENIKKFIINPGNKEDIEMMEKMLIDGRISNVDVKYDDEYDTPKPGCPSCTALLYQAEKGTIEAMQFLLEKGANPNLQDRTGNTALHNSIVNEDNSNKVKLLLDNKADFTIKNKDKPSPKTVLEKANEWSRTNSIKVINDFIQSKTISSAAGGGA